MPYQDIATDSAFERHLPHLRQTVLAELARHNPSIPRGYRFESVAGGDRSEDVKLITYSKPSDPEAFLTVSCEGSEESGYVVTDLTAASAGGRPHREHHAVRPEHTDYSGPERRT